MISLREPPRQKSRIAGTALALAWFSIVVVAYAVLLLRTGAVEPLAGFMAFVAGLAIAALAATVGVIACIVVWRTGVRGGVRALFAIALAAAVLGGPAYVFARAAGKPMINDVSTDLADPPPFPQAAAADRKPGDLPVPVAFPPAQAAAQKAAYPDLAPLRLALAPEDVSDLVIGLFEDRGWRTLGPTSYPRGGPPRAVLEAVARTALLGFKDDVIVRVRPDGDGSVVDMRSASRIGQGDLGANAERIRSFLKDIETAANAP